MFSPPVLRYNLSGLHSLFLGSEIIQFVRLFCASSRDGRFIKFFFRRRFASLSSPSSPSLLARHSFSFRSHEIKQNYLMFFFC